MVFGWDPTGVKYFVNSATGWSPDKLATYGVPVDVDGSITRADFNTYCGSGYLLGSVTIRRHVQDVTGKSKATANRIVEDVAGTLGFRRAFGGRVECAVVEELDAAVESNRNEARQAHRIAGHRGGRPRKT